jgi:hypothetical protein
MRDTMKNDATPRPWASFRDPVDWGFPHTLLIYEASKLPERNEDIIAYLQGGKFECISTKENKALVDRVNANAELIVRAVNAHDDLLAAAKEIYDVLQIWRSGESCKSDIWQITEAAEDKYRAAIAKAEGRE